jgi:general secretion pathway protein G
VKDRKNKLQSATGFTLFELVITLTVLAILIMGTLPLAQNAVKRDREIRLRETLRQMRNAIDEFKRDTYGVCPAGTTDNQTLTRGQRGQQQAAPPDPRSRVMIDDCSIFDSENLDRYPPSLEVLVEGVKVRQRGVNLGSGGGAFGERNATDLNSETEELKKVYLRQMPIDPMTGESDWKYRSSYQTKDDESWDDINVFDVRSASDEKALNGEKYSDW